jgi:beta-glucosidase
LGWLTTDEPQAMELEHAQFSRQAATEGMVLLENHGGSLPIATSGNIALFGQGVKTTVKGGTGSGAVNNRYNISILQGFQDAGYNVTTQPGTLARYASTTSGGGFGGDTTPYHNPPAITAAEAQPTEPTSTAVYVIARTSGEFADRSYNNANTQYPLSANELQNLNIVAQAYDNVVVVLNVGGQVDTTFYKTINAAITDPSGGLALDSLFLLSQAGQEGGRALVDVLSGQVAPSGKLVDTLASQYSYYPASATFGNADGVSATEWYRESIYVGYRYFDSFYKTINPTDPESVVNYPFGYGLSYTDFDIVVDRFQADMDNVTLDLTVTNVGQVYSGKEVVQVYFSAPVRAGLIDKPYQELAAYSKTDILGPGASQKLTISFPTFEMSSYYEATSTWRMDSGRYPIRVGQSSRDTEIVGVVQLDTTLDVEQLSPQLRDQDLDNYLVSNPANFYTYPGEQAELNSAPHRVLNTTGFVTPNNASPYDQTVSVTQDSAYYAVDGDKISTTTAYLDDSVTDWQGTGAPYVPKSTEGETAVSVTVDPTKTMFDVAKGSYTLEQFVAGLSVSQLGQIVIGSRQQSGAHVTSAAGSAGYTTSVASPSGTPATSPLPLEAMGIPQTTLADGPAGMRITQVQTVNGERRYQFGTAWPIATMLAQTFNLDLVKEVGKSIGEEMELYGVTLWLSPALNIHRDPLAGRNFEYYSEDPLVSGLSAAVITKAVQSSPGVGVTMKHYFGNNQETGRTGGNSFMTERTAREIYLKGFEIVVKQAQPMAAMTALNRVNGECVAAGYDALEDILRGEWGFEGVVMTDWASCSNQLGNMYGGNDLIEPGSGNINTINSLTIPTQPTWNNDGLPRRSYAINEGGLWNWTWSFGSLAPSATGASTIVRTVNSAPSGSTVQDLYDNIYNILNPPAGNPPPPEAYAFTPEERAGIVLTPGTVDSGTGDVLDYTVTIKGDFRASMRLGDLQRSAMRILDYITQTNQFAELAEFMGVSGIVIEPYSDQFTNLVSYIGQSSEPPQGGIETGPMRALRAAVAHYAPFIADEAAYTPESFAPFKAAWDAASALAAQTGVNPAQAEVAYAALAATHRDLVRGVDTRLLQDMIDYANTLDQAEYTTASWSDFATALSAAVARAADPTSDALVWQATLALQNAIAELVYAGDPTGLQALVDFAESLIASQYTPSTWAGVESALQAAQALLATSTDADSLDAAHAALLEAIEALLPRANTQAINNAISLADTILAAAAQYQPTTLVGLAEARAAAWSVATNVNASQAQVNTAYDALVVKIAAARLKPAGSRPASTSVVPLGTANEAGQAASAPAPEAVGAAAPAATKLVGAKPKIKGTAKAGAKLRAVAGKWTAGAKVSYRWYRDGKAIKGANKAVYTVKAADAGSKIAVKVTGKKAGMKKLVRASKSKVVKG